MKHLRRARPAGNALAAGFLHAELHVKFRDLHHVRRIIHHHHAARAHDGPQLGQRFIIHRRVQVSRRDAAARGSARLHGFDMPAVRRAAAHFLHDLPQRNAHRHFDQPVVFNLARQRKHLRAFAFLRANPRVPRAAFVDDRRDVRKRFHVVQQRRTAP